MYNDKKDSKDSRDFKINCDKQDYHAWIDLRSQSKCPAVLNRLDLCSQTTNTVSNVIRYLMRKQNMKEFQPSRLLIYYYSRLLEGTQDQNTGLKLRNVMKAIKKYGFCDEKLWKYNVDMFKERPPNELNEIALGNVKNFKYFSIDSGIENLKSILSNGIPIIFNMEVYESFNNDDVTKTGMIPMPARKKKICKLYVTIKKEKIIGIHCVAMYGYRTSNNCFICMNSYGTEWGERGFFYLPFD